MSRRVEELFAAAREVEVAEPPSLVAIRGVAASRARRGAYLAALAVALPLGAAAAAGGWVMKQRAESAAAQKVMPTVHAPRTSVTAPAKSVAPAEAVAPLAVPEASPVPATSPVAAAATLGGNTARAVPSSHGGNARGAAQRTSGEEDSPRAPGAKAHVGEERAHSPARTSERDGSPATDAPAHVGEERSHSPAGSFDHDGSHATGAPALAGEERSRSAGRIATAPSVADTPEIPAAPALPRTLDAATPAAGGPPARTSLSDEATLLTSAVAALRSRHDPAAALAFVAQHRSRFPTGALRAELTLVAAEAHRALGHTAGALTELDQLPADARGAELTVLRAELNAELGRCADARAVLSTVSALPPALRARADRVLASCP